MSGPGLNLPSTDPRFPILRRVRPPAFLLLVVGSLNVFFSLSILVAALFKIPVPNVQAHTSADPATVVLPVTATLFLGIAASLVFAATTIWGALNAMSLRGYAIAIMGALTSTLPLSCTCALGVFVGPWMFFTLLRPEVRKVFNSST